MARVDEAFVRPAIFVEPQTDILTVVRLFQEQRVSSVLVRDCAEGVPERLGIFTSTMVHKAVLDGRPLQQLAVAELANFQVITVRPSDQLGDAMATMLRHRVHRVVVVDEGEIRGVLEALGPVQLHVQPVAPDHRAHRGSARPGGLKPGRRTDHPHDCLHVPRWYPCASDRHRGAAAQRTPVRARLAAHRPERVGGQ